MINDDTINNAVPSDLSDHDERGEQLATEKHWDDASDDAAAVAGQRLADFEEKGVPLSDEDWEKEESADDSIPDHLDQVVDEATDHAGLPGSLPPADLEENDDLTLQSEGDRSLNEMIEEELSDESDS